MRISDWSSDVCSSDLEDLVGSQLAGAVEIDRACRLVGRQRDNLAHLVVERGPHHLLGADHVGLDALEGIVLCRRHLLQGGRVVDDVRSEAHTSELQSLMPISYAVFCLKNNQITLLSIK